MDLIILSDSINNVGESIVAASSNISSAIKSTNTDSYSQFMIAVIAALSAILGGSIPALISFFSIKRNQKMELEKKLHIEQREIYKNYLITLQSTINDTSPENFRELQKATVSICLYGDNETAKIINEYFSDLIQNVNSGSFLSNSRQVEYQTKIINSMRKHLDLKNVDRFELVSFNG